MSLREEALELHAKNHGKICINSKIELNSSKVLSLAYSPGVAEPCIEINRDKELIYEYTSKGNMVAVVTNGTAVLGLGKIGAAAALPVMEGKAVLFKSFAGIDAIPICLDSVDADEIIRAVKMLEPSFGGINLEDIGAPDCFEIEHRLRGMMDIPVFHDDQHGTAVVTLAGLINALKLVNKKMEDIKVVINGAGAAGIAIANILNSVGAQEIIVCDSKGIIYEDRTEKMDKYKTVLSKQTNKNKIKGKLVDAVRGADVFIGVSVSNVLTKEMVSSMADSPIVFALANPDPEIMPEEAIEAGAKVVATGRSDYPNQINNVLAFPGIFRGAMDVHARDINESMKIAAAYAIAGLLHDGEISEQRIIPDPFDRRVVEAVARAVAAAAVESGVARIRSLIKSVAV